MELINEYSKGEGYKINTYISVASLHLPENYQKKKLRKQSHLQSHGKKKKHSIHSNKEVKDSHLENYRTPMKENGHK